MLDVMKIREDFPFFKHNDIIYFDSSATSLKPQSVIDTCNDYNSYNTCNIHRGDYNLSFKVSNEYEKVRDKVARFINANKDEVFFTSGASYGLNMIAFAYGINNLKEGDVILTSEFEHASSVLPLFKLSKLTKAKVEYVQLEDGKITIDSFKKSMNEKVKLISLAYISNVLGYKIPLKEIVKEAHKYGAIVISDVAQAIPHIQIDVKDLDVDFIAFSAHKMLGTTGVGAVYGKYDLLEKLDPLFYGGGANARFNKEGEVILKDIPTRFEVGTPNIEGVLALGSAIDYLNQIGMDNIHNYEIELKHYMIEKLSKLDNVIIYNAESDAAIVSFNIKGIFAQDVGSYFNAHNIALRTGDHCAKLLVNVINERASVRASLYFYNTFEEIDRFIEVCKSINIEDCINLII